jgi:hypothetical protein
VTVIGEDIIEEIGAVEINDGHLVVGLTPNSIRLHAEPADTPPVDLDLHHARWLHTVLGRAIEQASREGL